RSRCEPRANWYNSERKPRPEEPASQAGPGARAGQAGQTGAARKEREMQLGFVSAILGDLSLDEVFAFARDEGFACVELMCWPVGGADRRYAGVTDLDVASLDSGAAARVQELVQKTGIRISGLGYYPNPLSPDADHRRLVTEHLKKVIDAAKLLGLGVVNTFIGRDPSASIEAQWPTFTQVWQDLAKHAEAVGIKIG